MQDFIKEDLARDEKEEKKIKALRKEKKEREEKGKSKGAFRGFCARGSGAGLRNKYFYKRDSDWSKKGADNRRSRRDIECFSCQAVGHMARDCAKLSSERQRRK